MKKIAIAWLASLCVAPANALELTSPDLHDGAPISLEQVYTRCGGQNVAPALAWRGAPDATRSYALTMIDLSVRPNGWSHWMVVGIPVGTHALGKGAPLPSGARALMTDFGNAGYAGPCPPNGSGLHRYQLTVWALRTRAFALPAHATATELVALLEKKSLAKASITGTFQR